MKKRILALVLTGCIAQFSHACEVYFTNDLVPESHVSIVDKRNPEKRLELEPGASKVKWGSKDEMAYFTVLTEGGSAIIYQTNCTPTKQAFLNINDIMNGNVDARYFILNPTPAQVAEEDEDCGCSAEN